MASKRSILWPALAALIGLLTVVIVLPQEWKSWAPGFLSSPALHLGLDLAGGTQLDFRISEEEIASQVARLQEEITALERKGGNAEQLTQLKNELLAVKDQQTNLVEAIRTVIERRINGLGVSEATITPSFIGPEKHLLVECPGIVDVQECIAVVGKTIQLEFKEEFNEPTEEFKTSVRAKAAAARAAIEQNGSSLAVQGQDLGDDLGIAYRDRAVVFRDQLPQGLDVLWTTPPGRLVQTEGTVTITQENEQGQPVAQEVPGIFLAEVLEPKTMTGRIINEAPKAFTLLATTEKDLTKSYAEEAPLDASIPIPVAAALRSMKPGELRAVGLPDGSAQILFLRAFTRGGQQIAARHILVSYQGAAEAPLTVTRTQEEALVRAQDLRRRLSAGADFAALARTDSDGPSAKEGGSLGTFGRGVMVPSFEEAAFALPPGQISEPVETPFGYHLIRVDQAAAASPDRADYDALTVKGADALTRAQDIIGRMQAGNIRSQEEALALRSIFFSLQPSGWKDTALDGKHFRAAAVTVDPTTNIPVVQITFDTEGGRLFQELTKRNITKRIAIFVGGELVSAPTVQQEIAGGTAVITGSANFDEARRLAQDLNTGAIPAPIHLVGQYTIEATLGDQALQTSLQAALIGTILLMIYMVVTYRLLGLIADVALGVYAALFFALLKLPLFFVSNTYVVLTLAGMAGIILSLGMAVDANVLVFERMKEELRKGKLLSTAVETSFQYAWPAIRDGNVSTVITCSILFLIGTSIVRGFAITLMIGVALSMFTAITVTRWLLRRVVRMQGMQTMALYGVKQTAA